MKSFLPALTGLRFVAAFSVIISHSLLWVFRSDDHGPIFSFFSSLSALGMTLFFVLSGFVIHHNYSDIVGTKSGLRKFFVARFARLYPLYFLALATELVIRRPPVDDLIALPFYLTLTQTWLYLPILGKPLASQFGSMTSVSWSISTEVFFYLSFPALCLVLPRRLVPSIISFCALALAAVIIAGLYRAQLETFGLDTWGDLGGVWLTGFYRWLLYFSPYSRILEFILGVLVSALVQRTPKPITKMQALYLSVVAIAGTIALQWEMFEVHGSPWPLLVLHLNFGFAPFVAIMIFVCAKNQNALTRLLSVRPIVLLGEASYSMYLTHPIIVGVVQPHLKKHGAAELIQMLGCLAAIAGVSLLSWRLIEMPARRIIRRMLDDPYNASSRDRGLNHVSNSRGRVAHLPTERPVPAAQDRP
ncbi:MULTISPECIES: acyltransferase [unclassified Bradyrhizobium]|uniref:acyltransferase family protein n=1 Tax=unclassified Bradyrhizobium TaxID=2631580 RepID=UPI002916FA61|nr:MULTISPECIES: acyltransferase [unclassified Bradyrhizobium]